MSECDIDTSVPDWVIEHPETLVVFQELRIDYCCGGKSLAYACQEAGLDAVAILSKIRRLTAVGDKGSFPENEPMTTDFKRGDHVE